MEKQTAVRETLLKEFANCSDKLIHPVRSY